MFKKQQPIAGCGVKLFICVILNLNIMATKKKNNGKTSMWIYFGVGILILLLLVWLTIADFWGDTDVNAILPLGLS